MRDLKLEIGFSFPDMANKGNGFTEIWLANFSVTVASQEAHVAKLQLG